MIGVKKKYGFVQIVMNIWCDYMVFMGFGYFLGVDFLGEKCGMILNVVYYDKNYWGLWNGLMIIFIFIGQGEVMVILLQIVNFGVIIVNWGYYIILYVVKEVEDELLDILYMIKCYIKVSCEYYQMVVEGMCLVVLGGICCNVNILGIEVCGKIGMV